MRKWNGDLGGFFQRGAIAKESEDFFCPSLSLSAVVLLNACVLATEHPPGEASEGECWEAEEEMDKLAPHAYLSEREFDDVTPLELGGGPVFEVDFKGFGSLGGETVNEGSLFPAEVEVSAERDADFGGFSRCGVTYSVSDWKWIRFLDVFSDLHESRYFMVFFLISSQISSSISFLINASMSHFSTPFLIVSTIFFLISLVWALVA